MQTDTLKALHTFEASLDSNLARLDLLPDMIENCLEEIDPDDHEAVVEILEKHTRKLFEVAHLELIFSQRDPRD